MVSAVKVEVHMPRSRGVAERDVVRGAAGCRGDLDEAASGSHAESQLGVVRIDGDDGAAVLVTENAETLKVGKELVRGSTVRCLARARSPRPCAYPANAASSESRRLEAAARPLNAFLSGHSRCQIETEASPTTWWIPFALP